MSITINNLKQNNQTKLEIFDNRKEADKVKKNIASYLQHKNHLITHPSGHVDLNFRHRRHLNVLSKTNRCNLQIKKLKKNNQTKLKNLSQRKEADQMKKYLFTTKNHLSTHPSCTSPRIWGRRVNPRRRDRPT